MDVMLTAFAEKSIQRIFAFYSNQASTEIAYRVVNRIFNKIESLELDHRFVLEGHFKIIYLIAEDKIIVTDVFDTRQNPLKILKRAK